ncbi:MAG: tRNA dihydrouridine synthase DusB [Oscillospiraceae bacterium]|jgi:nifR3 family TIM-barrel protein|nr:tRNA dihydrouridine synthase DusB [Oscillospiraceae bacterium]
MKIRDVNINGFAALAPMAGVADRAFRLLCRELGAGYVIGEMASSKGLTMSDKKTALLLSVSEKERPMAVQLFGNQPEVMAESAVKALAYKPDIIDINMGCPAPKVTSNGGGSALMKEPMLCGQIVRAVKAAVDVPVTVKIRKGWDENSINAMEIALICEANGADAITIHGRTRQQMYAPSADWEIIRRIKEAVSIPVIGNGDVTSALTAKAMYEQTGCDYIMIGRAALGNPWIFPQINALLERGELLPEPDLNERLNTMRRHIASICKEKGERNGMREARKHAAWYFKGMRGAAALREQAGKLTQLSDLDILIHTAQSIIVK